MTCLDLTDNSPKYKKYRRLRDRENETMFLVFGLFVFYLLRQASTSGMGGKRNPEPGSLWLFVGVVGGGGGVSRFL